MIWNFFTKLWPAQKDSNSNIRNNSLTIITSEELFGGVSNIYSDKTNNDNNPLVGVTKSTVIVASACTNTKGFDMERQRSTKRSSFRMRISRRIRSGFMPVPQYDSDYDFALDNTIVRGTEEGVQGCAENKEDRRKKPYHANEHGQTTEERNSERMGVGGEKNKLEVKRDFRHLGGSVKGTSTKKEREKYDIIIDAEAQLGYNFRQKRRSFGSESEKRRGERFQRREIEKKGTVEESDDDFEEGDSSGSSESHICDTNCPLIIQGKCPSLQQKLMNIKAQRRSSFTSSSSRDSTLVTATTLGRRPRPLASLSIDDISGGYLGHDSGMGPPIKSPGLLSTASMWSTSDLHHSSGGVTKLEDSASHGGTNSLSLSNVSGSFSERMHELVRAFSSRTQRAKEKISQPPTPSSESDYDAKSAISGAEEPQAPRNIRLGSFLPMGSRASDAFSDENHDHFVGVWHCKFKTPKFLKRIKFPSTLEPHSKLYVSWLFLVSLAFMYNAIVIPLRGVFPYQTSENVRYWLIADYICDFIYILDIIAFKSRLRFTNHGVIECDRNETKKHYMKKWMFKFDIISLTPLDLFYLIESVGINPWLRLPRVLKIQSYWEFYERCDQASRSSAHAIRIIKTMTYMLFLIHIETCGYYAVSVYEGLGSNLWVYSGKGIAYIRCFYLATKTATSIGNNPTPTTSLELSFMTLYWLSGVFLFALLIGQIRDIVEAAGMVKDNYRKKMDSCLWYMQSINLPKEMKDRVREWFLYNWEQQKTIDERSLVSSLPRKLQTDLAINVHFNTLSKVQLFQDCERNLLYDLVLKLKPILYLPGDYICKKGEVGKEMYIVTQGQVEVVGGENNETVLATLHEGSVFGEISLLAMSGRGNRRTADVRSKGYTNVFTLSKHDFEMAMTEYPDAQAVLKKRAKKLLKANAKMEKKHKNVEAEEIIKTPPETPKLLQTVIQVMDPDSNVVKHLTPSLRKSHRRRPHSRSHSHRLSPSTSNHHHLTPHRSLSFRHSSKCSSSSLDPSYLPESEVGAEKDAFDTDDENDEPIFDDSSDDVSLSEVLHDAGAISSFEEDEEEEDEILIIEQFETEQAESCPNPTPQRNEKTSLTQEVGQNEEQVEKYAGEECCENEKNGEGMYELDETLCIEETEAVDTLHIGASSAEHTHTSVLPGLQTNDTVDTGKKIGNGGGIVNQNFTLLSESGDGCSYGQKRVLSLEEYDTLHIIDSMENYIEKQRWPASTGTDETVLGTNDNADKVNTVPPGKLTLPGLLLSNQNGSNEAGGCSRRRKLSVVSPPMSPASPRDKQPIQLVSSNTQIISLKENAADLYTRGITPVEITSKLPLGISEHVRPKLSTNNMTDSTESTTSPALTNGLEGCCGGGPLVDIPAENRITCSVEIHMQNSSNSTVDIRGHTETML